MGNYSGMTLDSPNTTSAVTYKVQMSAQSSSTATLNRTGNDSTHNYHARTSSSITAYGVNSPSPVSTILTGFETSILCPGVPTSIQL